MTLPKIFLGSSRESLVIADAIQVNFEDTARVIPWTIIAKPARNLIEDLVDKAKEIDFAIFVFHPDDVTISRQTKKPSPRDNVIFETGLYMGILGRERVFIIKPRDFEIKWLSDLNGITPVDYKIPSKDDLDKLEAWTSSLKTACIKINDVIKRLGPINKENIQGPPPSPSQKGKVLNYQFKGLRHKRIGLVTGHLQWFSSADVWVNSENINMQMSRFYERSVSGTIRYLGARRDDFGMVVEDIIAKELVKLMGNNIAVNQATVLVTEAGELFKTNKVKRIFHVASVQGEVGHGYHPIKNIELCITNVLNKAESDEFKGLNLKSILFPLLGTGTGKGDVKDIANKLIDAAISYLEENPNSNIECVYFLATTDTALETCKGILERSNRF